MAKRGYLSFTYGYFKNEVGIAGKLAGALFYLHPGRRAVVDFNVMWLPPIPRGRLLDVGCGAGSFLGYMQQIGWEVEGVDFDPVAARNASLKGVQVRVGSLESQLYPDASFDAVTMSHFIEHVHDPRELVAECRRILKPGGQLVIVTPNSESFGHGLYGKYWMHLDPPRHLHLFNARNLSRMVVGAGFHQARTFTSIRDAYGMFIGSQSIKRTGGYDMSGAPALKVRWWARVMEFLEWVVTQVNRNAGEEVVVIAKK